MTKGERRKKVRLMRVEEEGKGVMRGEAEERTMKKEERREEGTQIRMQEKGRED